MLVVINVCRKLHCPPQAPPARNFLLLSAPCWLAGCLRVGGPPSSGGHAGGHAVIVDVVDQQVEIFGWATNLVNMLIANASGCWPLWQPPLSFSCNLPGVPPPRAPWYCWPPLFYEYGRTSLSASILTTRPHKNQPQNWNWTETMANQPKPLKTYKNWQRTMKNQSGTVKNYEN